MSFWVQTETRLTPGYATLEGLPVSLKYEELKDSKANSRWPFSPHTSGQRSWKPSSATANASSEPWKRVLEAAILRDASLAAQTDLVLSLWGHLVSGPDVFRQTTELVCAANPPPQAVVDALIEKLLHDRALLLDWLTVAQQRIGLRMDAAEAWQDASVFPRVSEPPWDGTQLALRGTYATCRILKARLLVALAPARFQYLEAECQELAGRIMRSLADPGNENLGGGLVRCLFLSQTSWIAKGIVETRDVWGKAGRGARGMIERVKFEAWCRAIGRKTARQE